MVYTDMLTRKDAIKIESLIGINKTNYISVPKDTPLKQSLGVPKDTPLKQSLGLPCILQYRGI